MTTGTSQHWHVAKTSDHSNLSCADLFCSHMKRIDFAPLFSNSLQCWVQVGIRKLSHWQRSRRAIKGHLKQSGSEGLTQAWRMFSGYRNQQQCLHYNNRHGSDPYKLWATNHHPIHLHLAGDPWFTCESVPSRPTGHSTGHNSNAENIPVWLF